MTVESDAAYETAKRLIAEAEASGATELSLNRKDTHALDLLPPEISTLHQLASLSLDDTKVSDLIPLAGLTRLTILRANSTPISDLAPLSAFTGLTSLSLVNTTRVSDLAPLAALTRLTEISLSGTRVSDLAPLAACTGLTNLWLAGTPISDLAPLAALTGLKLLSLARTRVSDLASLSALTGLTTLWLDNTQVSDFALLTAFTELTTLSLDGTEFSDLVLLTGLTRLTALWANNTRVSDLAPLAGLTELTRLWLNGTQVSDLTPLAGLARLTELSFDGTQVSDLDPLAGLTRLTELSLDGTQVSDLRPLHGLQGLSDNPSSDGLTFKDSVSTQVDPRIAEIARIDDPKLRAQTLFDYLEGWEPPAEPPGQRSAPIVVEFDQDDRLVESSATTNLSPAMEKRARDGWEALREFHKDAVETLCKGNLPNLERAIASFGRALGDSFEQVRPIALGTHGQRIVAISKLAPDILMDDAVGDVIAFAAAIETHLQRFPDWVEYLRDGMGEAEAEPPLDSTTPEIDSLSQALKDAAFVAPEIPAKLDDLIGAAKDADLPAPLARRGLLGSISNILSAISERALSGMRHGARDFAKATYDAALKAGGAGTVGAAADLLVNNGQALLWLAQKYPQQLGWIEAVLRAFNKL